MMSITPTFEGSGQVLDNAACPEPQVLYSFSELVRNVLETEPVRDLFTPFWTRSGPSKFNYLTPMSITLLDIIKEKDSVGLGRKILGVWSRTEKSFHDNPILNGG